MNHFYIQEKNTTNTIKNKNEQDVSITFDGRWATKRDVKKQSNRFT